MTDQQPLRLRDLPVALLRNRWAQLFLAAFVLLELYNLMVIPAFLATQKGIETKAVADNAALKQKAEAELAEWKALNETEIAVNAALAFIEEAKPEDEVVAALVIQMACTHTAAMAVLARLGGAHGGERRVVAFAGAAAKLLRTYVVQVEILRRIRHGGQQFVRVEHVHVHDGGQAIVGTVAPE